MARQEAREITARTPAVSLAIWHGECLCVVRVFGGDTRGVRVFLGGDVCDGARVQGQVSARLRWDSAQSGAPYRKESGGQ
jgi:hypothetical protein